MSGDNMCARDQQITMPLQPTGSHDMKMIGLLGLLARAAVQAQVTLPLPAAYPTLLGASCGGVHAASYVTGFDENRDIRGEFDAGRRCDGSARRGGFQRPAHQ